MRNSVQRFLLRGFLPKSAFCKSVFLFTATPGSLSLTHHSQFDFAKISKKKAEKLEKEKEKASNEVPTEIDFTEYEENLKQEIENYKVSPKKLFYLFLKKKTSYKFREKLPNSDQGDSPPIFLTLF